MARPNVDERVVSDFGREWQTYDQSAVPDAELHRQFERYFASFPWEDVGPEAVGFDAGCGSGRWARFAAARVGRLHCIDASHEALEVARRTLRGFDNCEFHHATLNHLPIEDASMDFGYSLGVLHHIPDTPGALAACVGKLRVGAPFLVYLYYAVDGRPWWFRALFRAVNSIRLRVSRWPHARKLGATNVVAFIIYLPLARLARLGERLGRDVDAWPLSTYRHSSIWTLRTDALDRFGTRVEKRFTKDQVVSMLAAAGLIEIRVSSTAPYWCAVGVRAGGQASVAA